MPLLSRFHRAPSSLLFAYVVLADACIWLGGLPFELYCRALLAEHRAGTALLVCILCANAALVALMLSAAGASTLLAGRGLGLRRKSAA